MDQHLSKSERERLGRLTSLRMRRLKLAAIWIAIIALIAGGSYLLVKSVKKSEAGKPGEAIPLLSREHIPVGTKYDKYNSNPPTSGPHYPDPAKWGFYDRQLPDELVVHNLEHGGIWISYKDLNQTNLVEQLKKLANQYSVKVIVTFRPENDASIAVAAWGRLLKLDTYDQAKIKEFIDAFINRGPEDVPF